MTKQHSHDSTTDGAHSHEHVHDRVSRRSFLSVIPGSLLAMQAFAQGADNPAERFRRMSEQAERTGLAESFKGITAAGEPTTGLFPIHSTGVSTAPVRNAAVAFLNSLTAA
ncbi:MAG TPA: hypothetical protein VLR90_14940, partial [Blastocatellia bacterium]|nr:hypothetical protein [Blastocatellia bacterium]